MFAPVMSTLMERFHQQLMRRKKEKEILAVALLSEHI
jgi:hypothetical protein